MLLLFLLFETDGSNGSRRPGSWRSSASRGKGSEWVMRWMMRRWWMVMMRVWMGRSVVVRMRRRRVTMILVGIATTGGADDAARSRRDVVLEVASRFPRVVVVVARGGSRCARPQPRAGRGRAIRGVIVTPSVGLRRRMMMVMMTVALTAMAAVVVDAVFFRRTMVMMMATTRTRRIAAQRRVSLHITTKE